MPTLITETDLPFAIPEAAAAVFLFDNGGGGPPVQYIGTEVGPGTDYPIGLTLAQAVKVFYGTCKVRITQTTSITLAFSGSGGLSSYTRTGSGTTEKYSGFWQSGGSPIGTDWTITEGRIKNPQKGHLMLRDVDQREIPGKRIRGSAHHVLLTSIPPDPSFTSVFYGDTAPGPAWGETTDTAISPEGESFEVPVLYDSWSLSWFCGGIFITGVGTFYSSDSVGALPAAVMQDDLIYPLINCNGGGIMNASFIFPGRSSPNNIYVQKGIYGPPIIQQPIGTLDFFGYGDVQLYVEVPDIGTTVPHFTSSGALNMTLSEVDPFVYE